MRPLGPPASRRHHQDNGPKARPWRLRSPLPAAVVAGTLPHYRLEDLVKGITEKNRHPEIDFGPPQGREIL